jgi:hypothetical protein
MQSTLQKQENDINCFHFCVIPSVLFILADVLETSVGSIFKPSSQYKPDAGDTPKSGNS